MGESVTISDLRQEVDDAIMAATKEFPAAMSVRVDRPSQELTTTGEWRQCAPGEKTIIMVEITH